MIKQIGKRIRDFRTTKGETQETIAAKLKLTPGAYAKIERGETDPSITRLYEIAAILKITIRELLEDAPGKTVNKLQIDITEIKKLLSAKK
jgi:transcriptional regulator with XRE-family HTH domain